MKHLFFHQEECVQMNILKEWQNYTLSVLSVELKFQWVKIQLIDSGSNTIEKNLEQAYLCLHLGAH